MTYVLEGQKWATSTITWDFADATLPADATHAYSNVVAQQDAQAVIESAFEAWSRVADVQFAFAPVDSAAVDIRIGWGSFAVSTSGSSGSEIGETDYYYNTVTNQFEPDVVVRLLDPAQTALYDNAGTLSYSDWDSTTLYQVTMHEIGHALGLAHDITNPDAIMYADSSTSNEQLSADDIAGIEAIYGAPAAQFIDIGANQETVSGTLSGAPTTIFGSSGALDYAGGIGLVVMDSGSSQIHDGSVTVFAGDGTLAAYGNQSGEFILGGAYASIIGGAAGSSDIVFGGTATFTYTGEQEAASVIGGSGSATITGGAGGGYYQGGSDGANSLTASGIGTVLVGGGNNDTLIAASAGYSYLVAGNGNETLIGSLGTSGSAGVDRFFLGSGANAVGLGASESELVTGTGTATIYGGGGTAYLYGGTGGADLFAERPDSTMDIFNFRQGIDHVGGGAAPQSISVGPGLGSSANATTLHFADGASIIVNNIVDPTGTTLLS